MRMLIASLVLAASVALGAASASAEDAANAYGPAPGDEVVVYVHRFKPESFEAGLKIVKEGFTAAQASAGQTRKNYILVDPANYEVVLVSYFAPGSSVEDWHKFMGRLDVLKELEPMRSEPLKLQRYTLDSITAAP
ncbi:MAG TPA: hypothetical protein PKA74_00490 [Bauldia sp.]|nr:hypothetical protein [Bauldia sp.]